MKTWQLPVEKKRQQATHAPSETDKNPKHVVSTACRPRVFQIALFKGSPNLPHIPYPWNTQWAQMRQQWHRPPKTHKVGIISNVPERYASSTSTTLNLLHEPAIAPVHQGGRSRPAFKRGLCSTVEPLLREKQTSFQAGVVQYRRAPAEDRQIPDEMRLSLELWPEVILYCLSWTKTSKLP